MAVLKAGGYGHGLTQLAGWLDSADVAFYGVASVQEARCLLQSGITGPIYILGPTFPDERAEIVDKRWLPSISSMAEAEHFSQLNKANAPLPVHITVDTGMGRGGFLPADLENNLQTLLSIPHLTFTGIGSHLPSADEDRDFTEAQFKVFETLVQALEREKKFDFIHLSNSAGLLDYQSTVTNLVRPGLMLYGISPLPVFQNRLRPVMSLKSKVSLVRNLPAGHGISYGRSCVLEKETSVATIGIGYGDGYSRAFSGNGVDVLIRGQRCPILGRVTMDQIMVDVSHLQECVSGDEVELFGEHILVSELAEKSGLIPWEILTGITPRVQRVYL